MEPKNPGAPVSALVLAKAMSAAGKSTAIAIASSLASISTRLAAVEARTNALPMMAEREGKAENLEELEAIEARIAALESRPLNSMERRLSRHADHLARLETRLKSLEGK